jgi:hypothetical protein
MKMSILRRTSRLLLVVALLLVTAHRLPAPIVETPENPTPTPKQSAKPKPKRTIKPKVTNENAERSTKKQLPSPTPPLVPAKPRATPKREVPVTRKSDVTSQNVQPNRAHQFDGVWKTVPHADSSYTLIIKGDKSAALTVELTFTLSGGDRFWQDLPDQFNSARELHNTYHFDSKESHTTIDSQIVVRWNPAKLVDWSPKSVPNAAMFRIAPDLFKKERSEGFTLKGAQLISSNGFSYNRVR